MDDDLLSLFHARKGLVCFVGAGGKKTTMYRLADVHPGRIALTATVFTSPFRKRLRVQEVITAPQALEAEVRACARKHRRIAYALPSDKPARLGGVPPAIVQAIHEDLEFDATFVKADGARLRWIKAPNKQEPVVPSSVTTTIPVLSVRAIGKTLNGEIAHRPELVAQVAQMKQGETITAAHVARLLASLFGALKNTADSTVIPVINMVENREQQRLATAAAEQALLLSERIEYVVLAAMAAPDPIVSVIKR